MSNSIKETETSAVRINSKTIYQLNKILSGKLTLGKRYISKKQKTHKDNLRCHPSVYLIF